MKSAIRLMLVLVFCSVFVVSGSAFAEVERTTFFPGESSEGEFSKGTSPLLSFDIPSNATDITIKITNGPDGAKRVSSAVVEINGEAVFKERDFNADVGNLFKELAVSADTSPTIEVTVKGHKSAVMFVKITGIVEDDWTRTPPGASFPGAR